MIVISLISGLCTHPLLTIVKNIITKAIFIIKYVYYICVGNLEFFIPKGEMMYSPEFMRYLINKELALHDKMTDKTKMQIIQNILKDI